MCWHVVHWHVIVHWRVIVALAMDIASLLSSLMLRGGHIIIAVLCVNLVSVVHHCHDAVALPICFTASSLCHVWCMVHGAWCIFDMACVMHHASLSLLLL